MKYILIFFLALFMACSNVNESQKNPSSTQAPENLIAILDTIWETEQTPIRLRDSLMRIHGAESKEFKEQQEIYKKNHIINEKKVTTILENYGWPTKDIIGERGNWTLCNVIQHSDNEIRIKYLPMMREAVKEQKLEPRFL